MPKRYDEGERTHLMLRDALAAVKIPPQNLLVAVLGMGLGAIFLFLLLDLAGAPAAQAGYLSIMLLIAPARRLDPGWRAVAGIWAVCVAALGFYTGTLGWWAVLGALVVVCLVQGLFRMGSVSAMTRAPANLVVFAGVSSSGSDAGFGQVLLGAAAAVTLVLGLGAFLSSDRQKSVEFPPLGRRLVHGLMLAGGSLVILMVSDLFQLPHASWAILSFCLILSVDSTDRNQRMKHRLAGTLAGAIAATLFSLIPAPGPTIALVFCAFLSIAYIRSGKYALFVTFLTPAVLLGTVSTQGTYLVAAERIAAILLSVLVALAFTVGAQGLQMLLERRDSVAVPAATSPETTTELTD